MESIQCSTALAITGAIRGTSREKLYQELGLDQSAKEDDIENSATFSKYFPALAKHVIQETNNTIPHFGAKHNSFRNHFFRQLSLNVITMT